MLRFLFSCRLGIAVIGVLLVTMSLPLTMAPQEAFAQTSTTFTDNQQSTSAQSASVVVSSNVVWRDTGISLSVGDTLQVSANGSWSADPGDGFTGPDGYTKKVADNFLNLTDIGVCASCATTPTSFWGGLIAYIGSSPPAAGSYTSTSIRPEAKKVFFVGSSFGVSIARAGKLWLTFNDDAYSANTGDNAGQVTATITARGVPPITPFRCPTARMSFPVAKGGYIGWIYRDPASIGIDPSGIHSGLDIWAGNGAKVAAIGTGTVTRLNGTSGVDVYYPSINLEAYTGHLKNIQIGVGSSVSAGTVIGYENGDHIHFSFVVKGGNDQSPNWGATTPHRDPTPYLAPNGNFDYQKGAREHWSWSYTQWCG